MNYLVSEVVFCRRGVGSIIEEVTDSAGVITDSGVDISIGVGIVT